MEELAKRLSKKKIYKHALKHRLFVKKKPTPRIKEMDPDEPSLLIDDNFIFDSDQNLKDRLIAQEDTGVSLVKEELREILQEADKTYEDRGTMTEEDCYEILMDFMNTMIKNLKKKEKYLTHQVSMTETLEEQKIREAGEESIEIHKVEVPEKMESARESVDPVEGQKFSPQHGESDDLSTKINSDYENQEVLVGDEENRAEPNTEIMDQDSKQRESLIKQKDTAEELEPSNVNPIGEEIDEILPETEQLQEADVNKKNRGITTKDSCNRMLIHLMNLLLQNVDERRIYLIHQSSMTEKLEEAVVSEQTDISPPRLISRVSISTASSSSTNSRKRANSQHRSSKDFSRKSANITKSDPSPTRMMRQSMTDSNAPRSSYTERRLSRTGTSTNLSKTPSTSSSTRKKVQLPTALGTLGTKIAQGKEKRNYKKFEGNKEETPQKVETNFLSDNNDEQLEDNERKTQKVVDKDLPLAGNEPQLKDNERETQKELDINSTKNLPNTSNSNKNTRFIPCESNNIYDHLCRETKSITRTSLKNSAKPLIEYIDAMTPVKSHSKIDCEIQLASKKTSEEECFSLQINESSASESDESYIIDEHPASDGIITFKCNQPKLRMCSRASSQSHIDKCCECCSDINTMCCYWKKNLMEYHKKLK
ncbi:hypothetical protein Ciccas_009500 [Cichlidogyrus casuarinus]|uniref:Uncharacterized protein n=1 Tax=Cichlidogyrus casuarinus TaxID=1844966 RepID=A0ABD2Q1C1_9PLAT